MLLLMIKISITQTVVGSYFYAFFTLDRTSQDFTDALEQIYKLTDDYTEYLQNTTGTKATVFPYRWVGYMWYTSNELFIYCNSFILHQTKILYVCHKS